MSAIWRARSFCGAPSPDVTEVGAGPVGTECRLGGATLALHLAERLSLAPGCVGLSFAATELLEELVACLVGHDTTPLGNIADEAFGRSLT